LQTSPARSQTSEVTADGETDAAAEVIVVAEQEPSLADAAAAPLFTVGDASEDFSSEGGSVNAIAEGAEPPVASQDVSFA